MSEEFTAIVSNDNISVISIGTQGPPGSGGGGSGSGTVTSVGLALPSSLFTISHSPVTTTGTLQADFIAVPAHCLLIGPASGSDAIPTLRALVAADIPSLTSLYLSTSGGTVGGDVTLTGRATLTDTSATFPVSVVAQAGLSVSGGSFSVGTHVLSVPATASVSGTNTGDQTITLTGDVTGSGTGSFAATFATVNGNVGSFGSATQVASFMTNAKGLLTAASNITITPAVTSITGLGTGVQTALGFALDGTSGLASKAYVDTAVVGLFDYKGSTDCSANPNYPAALKGDAYTVSVAGKIGGASGATVDVGDVFIALADNAGGTQASVGASWDILEHNITGGTTVGVNLYTLTNPSAITFLRVNANNTVSALSASAYNTALGLGTGDSVTFSNLTLSAGSGGLTLTGGGIWNDTALTSSVPIVSSSTASVGTAGSVVGKVIFSNATSGTITIQPATGALGSVTLTMPAVSGTILQSGTAVTVGQGGTGLTAGTSGGIPYYSSTSAITSSALLAANALMIGGGAGAAPATTTTGTGVLTILGLPVDGSDADAIGTRGLPQQSKSAAYTTVMADAGKHLYHPGADTTARTWTIDSNANVPYEIGTAITFVNDTSAGVITIAITSDTMILAGAGTTGSRTLAANGIATALKVTATRWIISGTGLT